MQVVPPVAPANGAAAPQNIHIVIDHKDEKKDDRKDRRGDDKFNRCLEWCSFLFKFGLFMAIGLMCIVMSQTYTCIGQPALLTYIEGVGIVLCWLALMVLLHFWYFEAHQNEHAGALYRGVVVATQLCTFALTLYGIYFCILEEGDIQVQEALSANGLSPVAVAAYSCSTQVWEASLIAVLIGLLYTAALLYRACNFYKINASNSIGFGGSAVSI